MNGPRFKSRRAGHGITGDQVCTRAPISRNKLFRYERGYTELTAEEVERLETALRDLIEVKGKLAAMARRHGCPELVSM